MSFDSDQAMLYVVKEKGKKTNLPSCLSLFFPSSGEVLSTIPVLLFSLFPPGKQGVSIYFFSLLPLPCVFSPRVPSLDCGEPSAATQHDATGGGRRGGRGGKRRKSCQLFLAVGWMQT